VLQGDSSLERELLALPSGEDPAGSRPEMLPAGPARPNSRALLSGPGMGRLLHEASQLADLVLVEAPPLLRGGEAVALMSVVDAVLVVASAGKTTSKEAGESTEVLEDAGANVLGLVVVHGRSQADDAPPGWPARGEASGEQSDGPAIAAVYSRHATPATAPGK
jgi:Mrp family chromosome partitioning ATPase